MGDDNPGWDYGYSNFHHSSHPTALPSSPTTEVFELLVIETTDQYGNTVLEVLDTASTFTTTVPAGSSLPTASTTSDPNNLLSPSSNPTPAQDLSASGSPPTSSPPATTGYGISNPGSSVSSPADQPEPTGQKSHSGPLPIGAIVVVPLGIIAACIVGFVLWRRRKAGRGGIRSQEMKMVSPEDGISRSPPGYSESTGGLLMTAASSSTPLAGTRTNNPLAPAASRSNRASQPVILDTNMDGAYFTGLDTSDAVSMASAVPHPDRSSDANSLASDEPPPPYRPRSVPPISRETSLRNPGQNLAVNTNVNPFVDGDLGRQRRHDDDEDDDATPTAETTPMHNPFNDPEDAAVSALSTPLQTPRWRGRGDEDARSMISEFSFEHEHR